MSGERQDVDESVLVPVGSRTMDPATPGSPSQASRYLLARLCQRILREPSFIKVEVTGRSSDGRIDGSSRHHDATIGLVAACHKVSIAKRFEMMSIVQRLPAHSTGLFGLLLLVFPAAAIADSFAFVVAPEQSNHECTAASAEKAISCAMKKCKKARGADCTVVAACHGGWAGIMGVMLEEMHFSDAICGAPSREAAIAALEAYCKGHLPNVRECFISELISPDGKSEQLEQSLDPKTIP